MRAELGSRGDSLAENMVLVEGREDGTGRSTFMFISAGILIDLPGVDLNNISLDLDTLSG